MSAVIACSAKASLGHQDAVANGSAEKFASPPWSKRESDIANVRFDEGHSGSQQARADIGDMLSGDKSLLLRPTSSQK